MLEPAPPRTYPRFVASALAFLCAGCPTLPEGQWEGEDVVFAAEHPERVCAGTRAHLDQRAGELLSLLGSDSNPIEFYLLEDVSEHCDSSSVGCAEPGVVYSMYVPHLHELVHARGGDRMPRVLEEGLATHLGDPFPVRALAPRERLRELITQDPNGIVEDDEYGRAGHFISFLMETYGIESVHALDNELALGSSASKMDAAFLEIFGEDADGVLEQYESYPDCQGSVDVSVACQQDSITLDFLEVSFLRTIDCSADDTIGPSFSGSHFVESVVEIGPSVDGDRFVQVIGDGAEKGGKALVRRCGPCAEGGVAVFSSTLEIVPEDALPAGRYLVQLILPVDASPSELGLMVSG